MDRDASASETPAIEPAMTLVSVRIPTTDLEALRLVAGAIGEPVAHLIRSGVQRELAERRKDPKFIADVRARRAELDRLVADIEEEIESPSHSDKSSTNKTNKTARR